MKNGNIKYEWGLDVERPHQLESSTYDGTRVMNKVLFMAILFCESAYSCTFLLENV